MTNTPKYKLNQWEPSDRIVMADFNADNAKIDAALAAVNGRVDTLAAGKAEQSGLNAEASARQSADNVEKQARQSADNAEKAAREAADTALGGRIDALTPRAGAQLLKTITMTQAASKLVIPLADVRWEDWKTVHLTFDLTTGNESNVAAKLPSGDVLCEVCGNTFSQKEQHGNFSHLILFPMFDPRMRITGFSIPDGRVFGSGYTYQHLTQLTVEAAQLQPYCQVQVWGEK